MPETLAPADIEAGLAPAKAAAKTECSKLAAGGETLRMVVVVDGPTGLVSVVEIVEFADNPKLAHCYSTELGKATFKKVRRPQLRIEDQGSF